MSRRKYVRKKLYEKKNYKSRNWNHIQTPFDTLKIQTILGQLDQNLIEPDTIIVIKRISESRAEDEKITNHLFEADKIKQKKVNEPKKTNKQTNKESKQKTITHWMELLAFMLLWLPAVRHCQKLFYAKWRIEVWMFFFWWAWDKEEENSKYVWFRYAYVIMFLHTFLAFSLSIYFTHLLTLFLSAGKWESLKLKTAATHYTKTWIVYVLMCTFVCIKSIEYTHSK